MKILVTGFDPFGAETRNPSGEAVARLPDRLHGAQLIRLEIPTVRFRSLQRIADAVRAENPDAILSVGQAGGRCGVSVERIGINLDHYSIPDNGGNQPVDEAVIPGAPDAYFSNLPVRDMAQAIQAQGIPASVSNTAGTFVCNHVLFGTRHLLATQYPEKQSGFIHIPFLPEQVLNKPNTPSMKLELSVQALIAAIGVIADGLQEK